MIDNCITELQYEFVSSIFMFLLYLGCARKLNPFLLSIMIINHFLSITIQFLII